VKNSKQKRFISSPAEEEMLRRVPGIEEAESKNFQGNSCDKKKKKKKEKENGNTFFQRFLIRSPVMFKYPLR